MNAKLLLFAGLVLAAPFALARDARSAFEATSSPDAQASVNSRQRRSDQLLIEKREARGVRFGQSGLMLSGPLIEGTRRQRPPAEQSLGRRILGLPIVRLFVPRPSPSPPEGRSYFVWGESDRPWAAIAEGAALRRSSDDPVTHEAQSLVSIGR